jgi:hypothetical protein
MKEGEMGRKGGIIILARYLRTLLSVATTAPALLATFTFSLLVAVVSVGLTEDAAVGAAESVPLTPVAA